MELLSDLDTQHLRRLRGALTTNVPGDPSFGAAVGSLLRSLVDRELRHPGRQDRDASNEALRAEQAAELEKRRGEQNNSPAEEKLTRGAPKSAEPVDLAGLTDDQVDELLARLQHRATAGAEQQT